jgi:hypothetical protein
MIHADTNAPASPNKIGLEVSTLTFVSKVRNAGMLIVERPF